MLTKRTNILFEEDLWLTLAALAQSQEVSVGELVREAVRKTYFGEGKQKKITQAVESILVTRKKQAGINYGELINHGRKH
ncbi:hypothetical protein FJZ40_04495 [Candidatus Shapirobacteria bacterium]|nr:hypothetical protein [Candidatus Shapirobacteria bacterium]